MPFYLDFFCKSFFPSLLFFIVHCN